MKIRQWLLGIIMGVATMCGANAALAEELFASQALVGRWISPKIEAVEGPNPIFGYWDFMLTETTWAHTFTAYADTEGKIKLFQYRVGESPYTLGEAISAIPNALAGDFTVSSRHMTAFAPDFVKLFTDSKCGSGAWEIGVEQDVTQTGCAFIPSSAACPQEHDIVVLDGQTLAFGDRSGDMCDAERPAAPSTHAFLKVREIYAVIQVKLKDGAAFQKYVEGHLPSLLQYGGKIVAANPEFIVSEGERDFDVFVVQEWPSAAAFQTWHESPEYAPWKELRQTTAAEWTKVFLLPKGLPGQH